MRDRGGLRNQQMQGFQRAPRRLSRPITWRCRGSIEAHQGTPDLPR